MLGGGSWSVRATSLMDKTRHVSCGQPLSTSAAACKGLCSARLAPCHIGCQLWLLLLPDLTLKLELLQPATRLDPADQVNLQQPIPLNITVGVSLPRVSSLDCVHFSPFRRRSLSLSYTAQPAATQRSDLLSLQVGSCSLTFCRQPSLQQHKASIC